MSNIFCLLFNLGKSYNTDMSKAKILLTIGVWVAVLPYLGFPFGLRNLLFTLTGFLIMMFSYGLYKNSKKVEKKKTSNFDNFSENHNFIKSEQEEEIKQEL